MVDHKTHCKNTQKLLGDEYKEVHRFLDAPYAWQVPTIKNIKIGNLEIPFVVWEKLGRRHRALFHDALTPVMIGIKTGDFNAMVAAWKHLVDDHAI